MWSQGPSRFVDTTNPRARKYLWDKLRVGYGRHGIRTFWLDEAEPEFGRYDFGAYRYHAGQALEVSNLYPQMFSRAIFEGQQDDGETDVFNLVRCAWAGSQRYGALVWSGDIQSSWTAMRLHGTRDPEVPVVAADGTPRLSSGSGNQLWSFGVENHEILARYVRLRERLRNHTRAVMRSAHDDGQPWMRGCQWIDAEAPRHLVPVFTRDGALPELREFLVP